MFLHKLHVLSLQQSEVVTVLKSDIVTGHKVEQEGTELVGVVLLGGEEDTCGGRERGGGIEGCPTNPS